ncbi:FKBP-type peptidyl-prolyl cis-trans isomerase [Candidatus Kaiserbacteria bacterium]|nr:FKBP-type peptidyl-prolyl cis-trans isomerase [Candidatus Kaiserbacteria bacterium]
MNTKNIGIGIIVIIVLAVGGYFAYKSTMTSDPQTNQNPPADQVQAQDIAPGTGAQASPGDTVSVLYKGQFENGTVFDSSEAHGNKPLTFVLGAPGMIPGFQIGVNGMKEGGERVMAIPPGLGYGSADYKDQNGNVIIPGNSTLIFNVKLLKVVSATSTSTQ